MKKSLILLPLLLLGAGCATVSILDSEPAPQETTLEPPQIETAMSLPVKNYINGRTMKAFGEYIQDRFVGYHVGDDVEVSVDDLTGEVAVWAIADGEVTFSGKASGYGGLMVVKHPIDGQDITAVYGHLDPESLTAQDGDQVKRGDVLGRLGDHESEETDGERKHLHFSVHRGDHIRIAGYANDSLSLGTWLNPHDFFTRAGVNMTTDGRTYDSASDLGGSVYNISFAIPAGMEIEYIPEIESLNIFSLEGSGTARDRSQILIRYFDASEFLTLETVSVLETENVLVGDGYQARRYLIKSRPGVPDFPNQPAWRNKRHTVTNFRLRDGFTRYFVVAKNPDLDPEIYTAVLASMRIN